MQVDRIDNASFLTFHKEKITQTQFEMLRGWGYDLTDLLIQAKYANSKNEGRRAISGRGIRINDRIIDDKFARIGWDKELKLWCIIQILE